MGNARKVRADDVHTLSTGFAKTSTVASRALKKFTARAAHGHGYLDIDPLFP
jgi:uncharacterized cupin superfamily protein